MIALLAFVAGMVIGGLLVHYLTPAEVAKLSSFLAKLSGEVAAVGTPNEPDTNLKNVGTFEQGKTVQPAGPQMGEQKPQPAKQQTTAATPNEPSKLARAFAILNKLSEEEDSKEDKAEDKKEDIALPQKGT